MSYLFTSQRELPSFKHLEAEPLSGALGATIGAVIAEAQEQGSTEANIAILDTVQAKRRGA